MELPIDHAPGLKIDALVIGISVALTENRRPGRIGVEAHSSRCGIGEDAATGRRWTPGSHNGLPRHAGDHLLGRNGLPYLRGQLGILGEVLLAMVPQDRALIYASLGNSDATGQTYAQ